jgi:hypothetical protein
MAGLIFKTTAIAQVGLITVQQHNVYKRIATAIVILLLLIVTIVLSVSPQIH